MPDLRKEKKAESGAWVVCGIEIMTEDDFLRNM